MRKINKIVIHHSLSEDGKQRNWPAIKRYHVKKKGWNDIGYHWGIEMVSGKPEVQKGRPSNKMGAHVRGMNKNTIGVCIVGNYDKKEPPKKLWKEAINLVRELLLEYKLSVIDVLGHREAQALLGMPKHSRKSCPGNKFDMDKFRKDLIQESSLLTWILSLLED